MADQGTCVECTTDILVAQHQEQPAQSATSPYDPKLDPSTFVPPTPLPSPSITIEFCDRCRWLHRASWVSTELFLTFPTPTLKAISILPLNAEETGGRFRVWLFLDGQPPLLVWDRKVEGGFPELKVLVRMTSWSSRSLQHFDSVREQKQRVRDHIQPGKSLGHSDNK
ncbi:uncharacterized protein FIBRA_04951 [Fibroporia radiculosa]|uniref:Rdx family-domain-containing protein n=1 Tax=Fibroporia radiculosa TaxID=599839 RepID=J4H386_9APHY|nr:uncharacterized protein FIBRA_04951 [Fibroporia radiculosa]CCM02839.1 predicted protein [Fibroporia radiculosa]